MSTSKSTPWMLTTPALVLFVTMMLIPLVLTIILSFHVFDHSAGIKNELTLKNYLEILTDPYYFAIFWRTIWISLVTTLLCLVIGAPQAYILSRMKSPWKSILLLIIIAPLLVSVVVRAFGWSILLGPQGLINLISNFLGMPSFRILYTETAVIIALVHVMMPFMVIPIWTSLQKLDPSVQDAALSLSATPSITFRRIVLPQILPGMLSGSLIVFGLSASSFAIPGLLGGRRLKMVATVVYDEYLYELNWPLGASIAILLLIANLAIMLSYNRVIERKYRRALG